MSATGTVKWFNQDKGFGFIAQEGGNGPKIHEYFVFAILTVKKPAADITLQLPGVQ